MDMKEPVESRTMAVDERPDLRQNDDGYGKDEGDTESNKAASSFAPDIIVNQVYGGETKEFQSHSQTKMGRALDRLNYYSNKAEAKLGIESRGIQRVYATECQGSLLRHYLDTASMWCSANMVVSTFALGALGTSVFELGFWDSFLTILLTNLLANILPAYLATFGAKTGLRQIAFSRYSFGWYGGKLMALLNAVSCCGWAIVNTIAGTLLLHAVSDGGVPYAVGVIIIVILTLVVSVAGYRWVHQYERYSWLPSFIVFLIVLGAGASSYSTMTPTFGGSGPTEAGAVLSFIATITGFAFGWTSLASDYAVMIPADAPQLGVALSAYAGLVIPQFFLEVLGALYMTTFVNQPTWSDAFEADSIGGLLNRALKDKVGNGFGGFLVVLLALTIVGNNIPNAYSFGISIQTIGRPLERIPRPLWSILHAGITIAVAVPGATRFEETLTTFLNLIAYYLAPFCACVLIEHFVFRKRPTDKQIALATAGSRHQGMESAPETMTVTSPLTHLPEPRFWKGYDLAAWSNPKLLPVGFPAVTCLVVGVACFSVLGMDNVWFVGPIAGMIGDYGGDIGFELSGGFALVMYPILRYLEIKFVGR